MRILGLLISQGVYYYKLTLVGMILIHFVVGLLLGRFEGCLFICIFIIYCCK